MIRKTASVKLAALSAALILHGALAVALVSREPVQIEGADGGTDVRLGNAFADMAAGTLSAEPSENTEVMRPDPPDHSAAEQAERTPPERTVAEAEPVQAEATRPERAETIPPERTLTQAALPDAIKPVPPVEATPAAPLQPEALALLAPSFQPKPDERMQALAPPGPERIEGAAPDSAAVARSLRPKPRSAQFEAAHKPVEVTKPAPKPKPKPKQTAKPAPGNATRNARAGEATGRAEAIARQSGTGGRQQAAGNAAASNYPGLVMRQISRAGKLRVNARGVAVVAFTIGGNGGLSAVSLARSSGNASLDQDALRLVRRAGPFPKPPQGARRSFSIEIEGR